MTDADKLLELLATRPASPTRTDLLHWWHDGGALVADLLVDQRRRAAELENAPGPLDEMAQNLMDELHKMKFEGAPIGIALRIDRLLDKAHALAVVVADTRIRLLAVERKVGRHV